MKAKGTRRGGRFAQRQRLQAGPPENLAQPSGSAVGANARGPAWQYALAPMLQTVDPLAVLAMVRMRVKLPQYSA